MKTRKIALVTFTATICRNGKVELQHEFTQSDIVSETFSAAKLVTVRSLMWKRIEKFKPAIMERFKTIKEDRLSWNERYTIAAGPGLYNQASKNDTVIYKF